MAASVWMKSSILVEAGQSAAAERADDAHRHGLPDAKRVADGQNDVAHLKLVAVGQRDGGQIVGFNFQDGDIRGGSLPMTLAVYSFLVPVTATLISSASATTWFAVKM